MTLDKQWMAILVQVPILGLIAGCAAAPKADNEEIPAPLRVSDTDVAARHTHGAGVQIYQCRAGKDDATHFEWQLKEPQADLFDKSGKKIGKHYAGPTWEANDGSKVVGELIARDPGPVPSAIPWLLLRAKSTAGKGMFAKIQFIQRVDTVGGLPPQTGCDSAHSGQRTRVAYSADYYFYSTRR